MKKAAKILVVMFALLTLFGISSGCNQSEKSSQKLSFNVKYIHRNDTKDPVTQQRFIIFKENKTGEYHIYSSYESKTSHYYVAFKYTEMDQTAFCFFDSVFYFADHNKEKDRSNYWSTSINFSENILMENKDMYISEIYLPNISNFD